MPVPFWPASLRQSPQRGSWTGGPQESRAPKGEIRWQFGLAALRKSSRVLPRHPEYTGRAGE